MSRFNFVGHQFTRRENGLVLCEKLKQITSLKNTKYIVLTVSDPVRIAKKHANSTLKIIYFIQNHDV